MDVHQDGSVLSLETRRVLYSVVSNFPGLHFREIQRKVRLATGMLEYHMRILVNAGLIKTKKDKKYLRFFPNQFPDSDADLISLLRQGNRRKIVLYVILNPGSKHKDLVAYTGLSSSTISWYLEQLVKCGVLRVEKAGTSPSYYVPDGHHIAKLIASIKTSFLDKSVDNFLNMWEEL